MRPRAGIIRAALAVRQSQRRDDTESGQFIADAPREWQHCLDPTLDWREPSCFSTLCPGHQNLLHERVYHRHVESASHMTELPLWRPRLSHRQPIRLDLAFYTDDQGRRIPRSTSSGQHAPAVSLCRTSAIVPDLVVSRQSGCDADRTRTALCARDLFANWRSQPRQFAPQPVFT